MRDLAQWRAGKLHAAFDPFARLVRMAHPASILEVGAGAGYYCAVASDTVPGVAFAGCDSSPAMLELAREAWPAFDWQLADQRDLSRYGDDDFDMVVNGCCLLHLDDHDDWARAIAEACRVARKWVLLHRVPVRMGDFAAQGFHRTVKHAYGVAISESWMPWAYLERMWQQAGLHLTAVERWNEGGDPEQASVLLQVRP